ncbi:unnamed protein product [Brachionus calyciflorus]|uniref:Uncharacterized protein n=1 Tax=Brachionus calyciflorus TaxID=104777 RepID=A0A814N5W5_9BILA|nr:unnamed protein product [Brachionus calyciflorus]
MQQQASQGPNVLVATEVAQQYLDIPVFETINGALVSVQDISFEVCEILGHFYGRDDKLYFDLRWKSTNGQDFVESDLFFLHVSL